VKTVPVSPAALSFSVRYSSTKVSIGDVISASAAVTYTGNASAVQMVLVDVRAPTGFVMSESDFSDMLADGKISFYEFLGGGRALVYLDNLARGETTNMTYTLTAMSASTALLQHVNAFDMYNISLRAELAPVGFIAN
jgi:acyl-CoA hydrolase